MGSRLRVFVGRTLQGWPSPLAPNSNWRMKRSGVLSLGPGSYSNSDPMVFAAKKDDVLAIGKDCSISYGVAFVFPGDHDLESVSTHPSHAVDVALPASIIVEDNVWIGYGSTVLAPVRIGTGAVVAAKSVVTRDVEANTLVAGVPARVLKRRNHEGM